MLEELAHSEILDLCFRFKVEEQAKYMERSQNLEIREARARGMSTVLLPYRHLLYFCIQSVDCILIQRASIKVNILLVQAKNEYLRCMLQYLLDTVDIINFQNFLKYEACLLGI